MNAKIEKLGSNEVKIEITVEAAKFKEAIQKAYKKNMKKYNIPGFRKGKAPLSIIKSYYGEGVFYEDAVNICCDDTYPEVLKENNITPVDYPEIDIITIEEGKDFVYSAKVTVLPEVELGEYKGLGIEKVAYPVTEEDILNDLKAVQEKNARIEAKEDGEVEKGNIAIIDFKGFIDNVPFEGGEGTDYSLEIGSGTFIGDFEDQLVGLKKGESKDVNVTFPENYGKEELNGKPAKFEVTVKEIKVKEVPALDDEFAKEASEFDTLEELKNDVKEKLQKQNDEKAKTEFEDKVVDAVCENAQIELPKIMIDNEINSMLQDLEMRLKYQGLDLKSYYEFTNSSEDKVRDYMKETAEKRVKTKLVLEAISKEQEITASDDEILEKATEMAKNYGNEEIEKTAKLLVDAQKDVLTQDIVNGKVIDFLVKSNTAV